MSEVKKPLRPLRILTNGDALLGITFLVTGIVTAREGIIKLQALWVQLTPHLPLSLPAGTSAWILTSLPVITAVFIGLVSSVAAVLMGCMWAISGISEVISSRKTERAPLDLDEPGLVAESLRTARPQYWKWAPWPMRKAARSFTRLRYLTPIPRGLIAVAVWNAGKFAGLTLLIGMAAYLVAGIPSLVQRYAQIEIGFVVPSPVPLYVLLWFLIILNVLIAASLLPFREPDFLRSRGSMSIRGTGEPHLFLALLEESSRLLSAEDLPRKLGIRLKKTEPPSAQGTLLESSPEAAGFGIRPAGYACLPLAFLLLTMGFSRLIHFHAQAEPMAHFDFLAAHGLDYLLEVLLAVAMILGGFHCADWARRLFGIRRFRSALVFCVVTQPEGTAEAAGRGSASQGGKSRLPVWALASGVDKDFAEWARKPEADRSFSVDVCWAEVVSEGVAGSESRSLTRMRRSETLDENMNRIMELPFRARFEPEPAALPPDTVSVPEKT